MGPPTLSQGGGGEPEVVIPYEGSPHYEGPLIYQGTLIMRGRVRKTRCVLFPTTPCLESTFDRRNGTAWGTPHHEGTRIPSSSDDEGNRIPSS